MIGMPSAGPFGMRLHTDSVVYDFDLGHEGQQS